jgi:hypothetical protein
MRVVYNTELFLISFFFYKIGEKEDGTGPAWGQGGWEQWEEGGHRERM